MDVDDLPLPGDQRHRAGDVAIGDEAVEPVVQAGRRSGTKPAPAAVPAGSAPSRLGLGGTVGVTAGAPARTMERASAMARTSAQSGRSGQVGMSSDIVA